MSPSRPQLRSRTILPPLLLAALAGSLPGQEGSWSPTPGTPAGDPVLPAPPGAGRTWVLLANTANDFHIDEVSPAAIDRFNYELGLPFGNPPDLARLLQDRRQRRRRVTGGDPAMARLLETARKAAAHPDATVLLEGERGTGKEMLAWWIHEHSPRATGPFVRASPPSGSAGGTSPSWSPSFWPATPPGPAGRCRNCRRRPWPPSRPTTGQATSGSWRTPSNGPSSWPATAPSGPGTSSLAPRPGAAARLGISRPYLNRPLKELGLR